MISPVQYLSLLSEAYLLHNNRLLHIETCPNGPTGMVSYVRSRYGGGDTDGGFVWPCILSYPILLDLLVQTFPWQAELVSL